MAFKDCRDMFRLQVARGAPRPAGDDYIHQGLTVAHADTSGLSDLYVYAETSCLLYGLVIDSFTSGCQAAGSHSNYYLRLANDVIHKKRLGKVIVPAWFLLIW